MPDSPPKTDGQNHFAEVIFIIVILAVIAGFIEDKGWDKALIRNENESSEEKQIGPISRLFGSGDIDVNKTTITKGLISVRSTPGGSIIGTQDKRVVGIVREGPFEAFGTNWWRMDYKERPDGWVNEKFITANVSGYKSSQFIPIIYGALKPIGIIFSVLFSLVIIFLISKRNKAYFLAQKKIDMLVDQAKESDVSDKETPSQEFSQKEEVVKNKRWKKVEELMDSHNVNDWRQAIIEADIILDEMLTQMNYAGETVAEKLKNVEESDFITLNKAWEAHKIRNRIAHSGAEFTFDKTEAERVVGLYRQVFREFFYI